MTQLFRRKCVATVQPPDPNSFAEPLPQATILDGLRCKFQVKKSLEQTPNQCVLTVYNISQDRRASLEQKHVRVLLEAGYEDTVRQIYSGDARIVHSTQQGPDWVTEFRCGDGERAYTRATFSETYAPGATVEQVVRAAAAAMGIDPGNAVEKVLSTRGPGSLDQYVYGYAFHGKASDALSEIAKSLGLTWSIQDGRLQFLRSTEAAGGEVIVISKDSGLVDSPTFSTPKEGEGEPRLTVKSMLQPSLRCGGVVEVRSRFVSGQFKIHALTHDGDTHAGPWYSTIEAEAV
jgi:hypothetical protein